MTAGDTQQLRKLPAVDQVLRTPKGRLAIDRFGHDGVTKQVRNVLSGMRNGMLDISDTDGVANVAFALLEATAQPNLRRVFNLTGTVLHTNLGRAILAQEAVGAAVLAMQSAVALEFDLEKGERGDRDDHVREILRELTGAEDATVVNNNAAAVLLTLNTLAKGREAIV